MGTSVNLSESERRILDKVREKLQSEGFRVSDERLLVALLRAIAGLGDDEVLSLVREGLLASDPQRDPSGDSPRSRRQKTC